MRFLSTARDADDQAAGIHIPVGSAETDECRYDIDAVRVGNAFSDPFRIRSRVDEAQAVAEPLDSRTGDEDRTFQGIFDFAVKAPGNGRDQAVLGRNRRRACVHEHEAACTVGVLGHTRFIAGLTKESRLLVTGDTGDVDRTAEDSRIRAAIDFTGRADFREHAFRNG